jgi:hypothetical protein
VKVLCRSRPNRWPPPLCPTTGSDSPPRPTVAITDCAGVPQRKRCGAGGTRPHDPGIMRATAFTTLGNLQAAGVSRPTSSTHSDNAVRRDFAPRPAPRRADCRRPADGAHRRAAHPAGQHAQRGGDRAAAAGRGTARPVPARPRRDTSLVPSSLLNGGARRSADEPQP